MAQSEPRPSAIQPGTPELRAPKADENGAIAIRAAQELGVRVLQDTASVTRSIAEADVLKEGDLFFISDRGGMVPVGGAHGLGLYYHDCRYLGGYELRVGGVVPGVLVSSTSRGYMTVSQLTLPDILLADGRLIPKDDIGIKRVQVIESERPVLHDLLTFHNYGSESITLPVSLELAPSFEDVFLVRGMSSGARGEVRGPHWRGDILCYTYAGRDRVQRELAIHFSSRPFRLEAGTALFRITLQPRKTRKLLVSLAVAESEEDKVVEVQHLAPPDLRQVQVFLKRSSDEWLARETEISSSSLALNTIVDRSLRDLRVLRSSIGDREYFAAGVPWFGTLFGRDSVITALQTLAFDPHIAEQTLRLLAVYQGTQDAPWRDEEPGKILHELRLGELARSGEIPHTPYYGSIDATPLFLILFGEHAAWTGSLELFHELRANVERALEWTASYGDLDGDGYLEYRCRSRDGLVNQGWRDSGDGVPNADGSLAVPPIALVEVQAYAYRAKLGIASLLRRVGEYERAETLEREAEALRERFNRDFWLEDSGFYALALQAGKRPAAVMSSNPGHALWAGIAAPDKARQTASRLMASDMFSGWGIRTLSSRELRFNPTGYHMGTVWPHDNSIVAAGLRRYGHDEEMLRLFEAIIGAAMYFPDYRLPELFMGFPRDEYGVPVSYPVACRPQAWAAGTVPYLVSTLLGLIPDAFNRRLWVTRPLLPEFVQWLEVRRLRVGQAYVDLRFDRNPSGTVAVDVLRVDGDLDVVMRLATTAV